MTGAEIRAFRQRAGLTQEKLGATIGVSTSTMYCACLQETGHTRACGVERTYQRYRTLSPLSLDAARAAELGVSYGAYKARGVV